MTNHELNGHISSLSSKLESINQNIDNNIDRLNELENKERYTTCPFQHRLLKIEQDVADLKPFFIKVSIVVIVITSIVNSIFN